MALVAERLSVADLEARYEACEDVTSSRHFQTIFLLAKGHLSTPEESVLGRRERRALISGAFLLLAVHS